MDPEVLDILKQKNVPGVFFVIGNMATSGRILQREYAEGHEIAIIPSPIQSSTNITPTEIRWQLN